MVGEFVTRHSNSPPNITWLIQPYIAWLNEPGILVKLATIVIKLNKIVVKLTRKLNQEY
jgi:hypothetical protein